MSGSQNLTASRTDARDRDGNNLNTYRNQNQQSRGNDPRHYQQQQRQQQQQQQWQRQQQWQNQKQWQQQQQWQHQKQWQKQQQWQQQKRQQQQQQQQQQQRQVVVVNNADRNDSDNPNAAVPLPVLSVPKYKITNLERYLQSLTPVVRARRLPAEVNLNEQVNGENGSCPFFYIGDLWESFTEWSAYGAGVPLMLSDGFRTTQFYCPSLSGMQIYLKPKEEEVTVGSTNEEAITISHETESETKSVLDGSSSSASCNLVNLKQLPSDYKSESFSSRGTLEFQFFESILPHRRRTLSEKASELAPEFPQLSTYRSSDLLPTSWVAVLWFPIYRVPTGPTRKNIEASFLTIHSLSTQPGSINEAEFSKRNTGAVPDEIDLRLPIIGLANYKLHGSIIAPNDPRECLQEKVWFEASTNWLHDVEAHLPDHMFFLSRRFSR